MLVMSKHIDNNKMLNNRFKSKVYFMEKREILNLTHRCINVPGNVR